MPETLSSSSWVTSGGGAETEENVGVNIGRGGRSTGWNTGLALIEAEGETRGGDCGAS